MALDNAQFISELSITDPPGTDAVAEGDDHIRTVKRATQQSFPNVDAAVPQTAAQMAQMALKSESNTFIATNLFQSRTTFGNTTTDGVAIFADGSALLPSIAFTLQPGTGMYRPGTSLGFTIAGVAAAFLLPAQLRMLADGSAAAPAYSFGNNTNMGWYRENPDTFAVAVGGVRQARIFPTLFQVFQQFTLPDGTEADPGLLFTGTGGVFGSVNGVTVTFAGAALWAMSTNGMFAAPGFVIHADGDLTLATKPGFSFDNDGDTGFYRASANVAGIAAAGLSVLQLGNGGIFAGAGFVFQGIGENTPNKPAYTFSNDTDTGFFRIQANVAGISAAGTQVMSFGVAGIGIRSGTPAFFNLPTSPGVSGSLWFDTSDSRRVKVA